MTNYYGYYKRKKKFETYCETKALLDFMREEIGVEQPLLRTLYPHDVKNEIELMLSEAKALAESVEIMKPQCELDTRIMYFKMLQVDAMKNYALMLSMVDFRSLPVLKAMLNELYELSFLIHNLVMDKRSAK